MNQISCRESASRNGMKVHPPGGLTSAGAAVYSGATVPESHRLLPADTIRDQSITRMERKSMLWLWGLSKKFASQML
ncbi:hypothetical protein Gain_0047_008 [Komagataeibacter intermedius TF2]|uniref:Uncharacterized protein n=2 Tax=Komagataeibacter intermedius TaxID=66229 RepID=A0A0N0MH85_9PROT|nr:hypothetical protein GLUCOINTEAF2_0201357 [Komagataeibacter intermedius AF2]GAN87131.1 hypothetical protein Gain_0047_008 [Komagataeibacter intermedius TF2]GBQ67742.1 hypothetical protein AA0521_1068 [Komagataeibacter intermedius NRIC 0521]